MAASCALLITLSLSFTVFPSRAFAQALQATLSPNSGPPGTPVVAKGSGWLTGSASPGDQVCIFWNSGGGGPSTCTSLRQDGTFTINSNVPSNEATGQQLVTIEDLDASLNQTNVPFTVTLPLSVLKVWTADGNNSAKTYFAPGDTIHYIAQVSNPNSSTVTATFNFLATGPQKIFSWSGPGAVPPGQPVFYSPSTVPSNAPVGTYTLTVSVTYGVGSSGQSVFAMIGSKVEHAIAWAESQINKPEQNWSGFCEKFVEYAYGIYGGAADGGYGTAQDAFKPLHTSTNWSPDIGALVWFTPEPENQNDGHVGIYIGNGQFISAIEGNPVVQIHSLKDWSTHAPYEGWGDAPTNWPGR